jgi:hypothetical protein
MAADALDVPRIGQHQRGPRAVEHHVLDHAARVPVCGRCRIGLREDREVAAMRMAHERGRVVRGVDDRFERRQAGRAALLAEVVRRLRRLLAYRVPGERRDLGERRARAHRDRQVDRPRGRDADEVAVELPREPDGGLRARETQRIAVEQHEQAAVGHGASPPVRATSLGSADDAALIQHKPSRGHGRRCRRRGAVPLPRVGEGAPCLVNAWPGHGLGMLHGE